LGEEVKIHVIDASKPPQEVWGQAILDLKDQFPDMTASQRHDWLIKFTTGTLTTNGVHDSIKEINH